MQIFPNFDFEEKNIFPVAGVDEVGRGPWAGPVIAAAVILDPKKIPLGINDSKKLSVKKREILYAEITSTSIASAIGLASVAEIDSLNILEASKLAMQRAIEKLSITPNHLLIDGIHKPSSKYPCTTIIKGDQKSLSIAAASIIAKVTRDRIMEDLAKIYPQYGWEKNAGYGTKLHQEGLEKYGANEHHRQSFKPIKLYLRNTNSCSLESAAEKR
jgi:ribonuclease HII